MRLSFLFSWLILAGAAIAGEPATRPVGAQPSRVLILPFGSVNEQAARDWIGQAVQQNLVAELARVAWLRPIELSNREDSPLAKINFQDALKIGKENDARYVIFGSYQAVVSELRITGQIIDATSGEIIGGLKVTGPLNDLFAMEDALASQARRQLPRPAAFATDETKGSSSPIAADFNESARPPVQGEYEDSALARSLRSPAAARDRYPDNDKNYRPYPEDNYYPRDYRYNTSYGFWFGNIGSRPIFRPPVGGPNNPRNRTNVPPNVIQNPPPNVIQNPPPNTIQNPPSNVIAP